MRPWSILIEYWAGANIHHLEKMDQRMNRKNNENSTLCTEGLLQQPKRPEENNTT
jgi:hypothetical protein